MNDKKLDRLISKSAIVLMTFILLFPGISGAGMADGHSKFLGNIFTGTVDPDFSTYWNQVTPGNAGKWVAMEPQRDKMSWKNMDTMFDYARGRSLPVKQHNFIWGSAQPVWINSLPSDQQKAEIVEWIFLFCQRYPEKQFIDVVNEPLHDPPPYKAAIGGDGVTGWDWVIWAFQQARTLCPNSKLLINEFNIEGEYSTMTQYISLIQVLKYRGLLDGIGVQGHSLEDTSSSELKASLDRLATLELPIYISELDIQGDDDKQLSIYKQLFPVMWEHPGVYGITLWGYKQGQMWRPTAYLLRSDGSERPALSWLRSYLAAKQTKPPKPPFRECIVVGVPLAAHRTNDSQFPEFLTVRQRRILASTVRVVCVRYSKTEPLFAV